MVEFSRYIGEHINPVKPENLVRSLKVAAVIIAIAAGSGSWRVSGVSGNDETTPSPVLPTATTKANTPIVIGTPTREPESDNKPTPEGAITGTRVPEPDDTPTLTAVPDSPTPSPVLSTLTAEAKTPTPTPGKTELVTVTITPENRTFTATIVPTPGSSTETVILTPTLNPRPSSGGGGGGGSSATESPIVYSASFTPRAESVSATPRPIKTPNALPHAGGIPEEAPFAIIAGAIALRLAGGRLLRNKTK